MPCYHPLMGWRSRSVNPSGKRAITFDRSKGFTDLPVTVPCGQCIGCRLERSRQWAMRCYHEASLYDRNCFITLTYDDCNLPESGSVDVRTFQLFMKRLRKVSGKGVRFFACGEYGELYRRPHYHACIFNFDFDDRKLFKKVDGIRLYTSQTLSELWPFGFSTIGDVTFDSAAYVARYITKKITGDKAHEHYGNLNPEFITMSRGSKKLKTGGIGKGWFDLYKDDVYNHDFVVVRGKKMRPAKFYDKLFDIVDPDSMKRLKALRGAAADEHAENNTFRRLDDRLVCQERKAELLPRSLEKEI